MIFKIPIKPLQLLTTIEVEGIEIKNQPIKVFYHKHWGDFTISEYETGLRICEGDTLKDALKALSSRLKLNKVEGFKKQIKIMIKKYPQLKNLNMKKTNAQLEGELRTLKALNLKINEQNAIATENCTKANESAANSEKKYSDCYEKYIKSIKQNADLIHQNEQPMIKAFKMQSNFSAQKPKQVSIDIIAICQDNQVENPRSMTIAEAKKVEFAFRNLFQTYKAFGE